MFFRVPLVFVDSILDIEEDQLVCPEDLLAVFTAEEVRDVLDESALSEEELELWSSTPSSSLSIVKGLAISEKLSINLL